MNKMKQPIKQPQKNQDFYKLTDGKRGGKASLFNGTENYYLHFHPNNLPASILGET